jgi:hypothetical protein
MDIHQKIRAYHGDATDGPHHRYRSWEHCFSFFRRTTPAWIVEQRDHAALQLGFYLASWGMYRGSSFLLQHAYTIHLTAVDCLASRKLLPLWNDDVGSMAEHEALIPTILDAVQAVRQAYQPFGQATDTLVTKVLLGTLGCLPACDRFFIEGFKKEGYKYSRLNNRFVDRVLRFCRDNAAELRDEQIRIREVSGAHYPFMKLVDMYFWQVGFEANASKTSAST